MLPIVNFKKLMICLPNILEQDEAQKLAIYTNIAFAVNFVNQEEDFKLFP